MLYFSKLANNKIAFLLCFLSALSYTACKSKALPTPQLTPKEFPSVVGENLDGKWQKIPESLKGQISIILVGYKQNAQFDIDRWILGLIQSETPAKIVEVAAIEGMIPKMVSEYINNGMRSGIPEEDWKNVVTVYKDANKISAVFGNERPQSAYVFVLDKNSRIVYFYNRGYTAERIIEIDELVKRLEP